MKWFLVVLAAALLALSATGIVAEGKLAVDPNAPRNEPAAAPPKPRVYDPSADPDIRMAKKVTYEGISVRLSRAIGDIGKESGVRILCGKNGDDWQVRDIPVTLSVKDMPLGTLLRAISWATHLYLSTEKPKDDELRYRLWRDKRHKELIDQYEKAKNDYKIAWQSWGWDALCLLKDVPDSQIRLVGSDLDWESDWLAAYKAESEFCAALGPEAKQRIFAGEEFVIKTQDAEPRLAQLARNMIRAEQWKYANKNRREQTTNVPPEWLTEVTPDQMETSEVRISLDPSAIDSIRGLQIKMTCDHPQYRFLQDSSPFMGCQKVPEEIRKKRLPPEPKRPEVPTEDCPNLGSASHASGLKPFDEAADLSAFKDRKDYTWGDVIVAVAKQAGVPVVCEDFKSYRSRSYEDPSFLVARWVAEPRPIFTVLDCSRWEWRAVDMTKALVGWDRDWPERHLALAPASVVDPIYKKLNGDGAQLEDLLTLLSLTSEQFCDWVDMSQDTWHLPVQRIRNSASLWRLYASLSPEQNTEAQSAKGLPLSKLDQATVSAALQEWKLHNEPSWREWWASSGNVDLTDPGTVESMVLQVQVNDKTSQPKQACQKGYSLEMYRNVEEDANQPTSRRYFRHQRLCWTGAVLPMYSEKRSEELRKAK